MTRRRILVADDDPAVLGLLAEILEGALGMSVEGCGDGQEALDRFAPGTFDLVVLDLVMPRKSGLQALAAIREQDAAVPVLVVSGEADGGAQALVAGASAFLAKPFTLRDVTAVVRGLLGDGEPLCGA